MEEEVFLPPGKWLQFKCKLPHTDRLLPRLPAIPHTLTGLFNSR